MSNDLILFDTKFNIKENKLLSYLYNSTETVLKSDGEKFIYCFTELYRLPILKPLLDAILTEAKKGNAKFILQPLQNWDRVAGHCTTSFVDKKLIGEESSFKKGIFSKNYKIVIKKFIPDILIHEIGHAIEQISEIDINQDFRKNFAMDMQLKNSSNRQLSSAIEDVMEKQLKSYQLKSIMAELFARFFEMLAMSKEVGGWGDYQFTYLEISKFFLNTIDWTEKVLHPILYKMIDKDVSLSSLEFVNNLEPFKKQWTSRIQSKFANANNSENKWQSTIDTSMNSDKTLVKNVQDTMANISPDKISVLDNGVEYVDFRKRKG